MATIPVKAEDDIRNRWFCNHQATMHDYTSAKGDKISVIDWRKPGTGVYSVRYLLDRNYLHVTGDCGDALYQLTEEATLERLAHYDMDYLFGKLRCMDSEGGPLLRHRYCSRRNSLVRKRIWRTPNIRGTRVLQ